MKGLFKILVVFLCFAPNLVFARGVVSRAARVTNTPTSGYTYNYMYPYLNNQMRSALNPGDANAQSTSPINAIVKTSPMPESTVNTGRVVARSGRATGNAARSATNRVNNFGVAGGSGGTRSGAATSAPTSVVTNRRVSPRGSVARAGRTNATYVGTVNSTTSGSDYVSSSRCLADYTECMNSYCMRSDMPYNRCFCSSKLAQIESTYQTQIDDLIKRILRAGDDGQWTDAEMAEYWYDKMGQYVGENAWENLDDALNIDWADADERMRGQNAYLTGHEYCVNHLKNCAYAAANMRDVYRSEISRDCTNYEKSLDKLKTALESALETYSE